MIRTTRKWVCGVCGVLAAFALTLAVGCAKPGSEVCAAAAAHVSQCTGIAAGALPETCDTGVAEQLLAAPCEDLVSGAKADSPWWCGRLTRGLPGCGDDEQNDDDEQLVCPVGEIMTAHGCVCPAGQIMTAHGCVCPAGQILTAQGCVAAECSYDAPSDCGETSFCYQEQCTACTDGSRSGSLLGYAYRNCDAQQGCECLVGVPKGYEGSQTVGRCASGQCVPAQCDYDVAADWIPETHFCAPSRGYPVACTYGETEGQLAGLAYRNCNGRGGCECLVATPAGYVGRAPLGRCENGACVPLPDQSCEETTPYHPELQAAWKCVGGSWTL